MPDLRTALLMSGAITKTLGEKAGRDVMQQMERIDKEADAKIYLDAETRNQAVKKSENEKQKRLKILQETTNPKLFRSEAKKLPLLDPRISRLEEVLRIAHANGMRENRKGGSALIAQLYQLKEKLSVKGLSEEEATRLVERTVPKH